MDVDRVACFHDAVLGYSSMLYELKPDSGFDVFQEVVKKLWKALENDVNLPKKLVRHRHIEAAHLIFAWGCCQQAEMFIGGFSSLGGHRSPFGVAEDCQRQSWVGGALFSLSSFSHQQKGHLPDQCTEREKGKRGIMRLRLRLKPVGITVASSSLQLSLDAVLELQIPEESDEAGRMRCYSLEDLRELQNKLMLMSGKGDQGQNEVDHFVEVCFSLWQCCSQLSQQSPFVSAILNSCMLCKMKSFKLALGLHLSF